MHDRSPQATDAAAGAGDPPVEPCEHLSWDSEFFGRRIARVRSGTLDPQSARAVMAWSRQQRIECLYLLADAADPATVRLAEDCGFRFVDIRLTFGWKVQRARPFSSSGDSGPRVRPATVEDIPALRAIARTSYRTTRFYFDLDFPSELADSLYETWTEKSCRGYADVVLVADTGGEPLGYVSCHLPPGGGGQIGLVGVREDSRGRGIGQHLLDASLRWFVEREADVVRVVTQGRNPAAQRAYEQRGFLLESMALWYHRWFRGTEPLDEPGAALITP